MPLVVSELTVPETGGKAIHYITNTFEESGKYLMLAIIEGLTLSLLGVTSVGVDLCGWKTESIDSLCAHWY
jgi:alpha-glucosidase (family GH31 glycosyl hydrolase)